VALLLDAYESFRRDVTLVTENVHWAVLLRQRQVTAGAMIILLKAEKSRLSELTREEAHEFLSVCSELERFARDTLQAEKFNYLALMMVDPIVHFHFLPRYSGPREFFGMSIEDPGWPGVPLLDQGPVLDSLTASSIARNLMSQVHL